MKFGCVIMASGLGKRFGANKLMAQIDGRPMIEYVLDATEGLFEKRVVVTRHEDVALCCSRRGISFILHDLSNRNDTVRLGIEYMTADDMSEPIDSCFFFVGDQPFIKRGSIVKMMDFLKDNPCRIIKVAFGDQPGNPMAFPKSLFQELKRLPKGKGGNFLAKKYPEILSLIQVSSKEELFDIDRPEDIELCKRDHNKQERKNAMNKYDIEWFVNDDGAQVRRLILHMPQTVKMAEVAGTKFSVYVERKDKDGNLFFIKPTWDAPKEVWTKGYRTIVASYTSDAQGNPTLEGEFVTLELDMNDLQSRAIVGALDGSFFVDCQYRVMQTEPIGDIMGLVFDELGQIVVPQEKGYTSTVSSYKELPLKYSYYDPGMEGDRPVIIWLHGAGEGGEDPRISYLGNNVVALSSDPIQGFMGGAWVLVPTSPTMWMDDGSHQYGFTGKSMYAEALFALIDEFVNTHAVDKNRIYIGGCSNGGFMTMRQIIDHPDYFAAGYPMCEALYDNTISDEDIENIKYVPIWFLHAMTDGVVNPETTSVPTYKRLIAAGAKNVHMTYIDDRPPFHQMVNHGCWPLGLRNEENYDFDFAPVMLDGKPTTRFEWLAAMHK